MFFFSIVFNKSESESVFTCALVTLQVKFEIIKYECIKKSNNIWLMDANVYYNNLFGEYEKYKRVKYQKNIWWILNQTHNKGIIMLKRQKLWNTSWMWKIVIPRNLMT